MTVKELLNSTVEHSLLVRVYSIRRVSPPDEFTSQEYVKPNDTIRELMYGNEDLNQNIVRFNEIANCEVDYWAIHLNEAHLEISIRIK